MSDDFGNFADFSQSNENFGDFSNFEKSEEKIEFAAFPEENNTLSNSHTRDDDFFQEQNDTNDNSDNWAADFSSNIQTPAVKMGLY